MSGEATIDVIGNLGGDPEMNFTPSGDPVASFNLANTPRRKTERGEWVDQETTWFRVSAWRRDAEKVVESLVKGDRVRVIGRFSPSTFEGKDGQTRQAFNITADMDGVTKVLKAAPREANKSNSDPWG